MIRTIRFFKSGPFYIGFGQTITQMLGGKFLLDKLLHIQYVGDTETITQNGAQVLATSNSRPSFVSTNFIYII